MVLCTIVLWLTMLSAQAQDVPNNLLGKVICLDPGHGGTADSDDYRVGIAGEREEWINLRVGLYLKALLEGAGATVLMTRTEDVAIPLPDRAQLAIDHAADLFLSIHHNATADTTVNFPVIYFHGHVSENKASIALAKCMGEAIVGELYSNRQVETPVSIVSDHTVFPKAGTAVLRHSYGIPALIVEASFFTNPMEEQRLKKLEYNQREAQAYLQAIACFFNQPADTIYPKYSLVKPMSPFAVLQEADRMNKAALAWHKNYMEAKAIFDRMDTVRYKEACVLLLQSVTSFPDSYIVGDCLDLYVSLLHRLGREEDADDVKRRRSEYYP